MSKGEALEFASDDLKDDLELVELAIEKSNGYAIDYASERLKRELFRKTFEHYSECPYLEEFENDREITIEYVRKIGNLFSLGKYKEDREVVKIALENGASIIDASPLLRVDRELCLIAFKSKTKQDILYYVSDELKNDREFVLEAVRNYGRNIRNAPDKFISTSFCCLKIASYELRNDKEMLETFDKLKDLIVDD